MLINRQQVYLDFSNFDISQSNITQEVIETALHKVQHTFAEVQVDFTLEPPLFGDYSTIEITNTSTEPGDYWGRAEESNLDPNDNGQIRLDNIESQTRHLGLSEDQLSNAISNSVSHEVGHLLGLDHTIDHTRVMGDEVNLNMINHQLTFSPSEVNVMNSEIDLTHSSQHHSDITENEIDNFEDHTLNFDQSDILDSEDLTDSDGFDLDFV